VTDKIRPSKAAGENAFRDVIMVLTVREKHGEEIELN
jgi:hypothetical protein